MFYVIAAVAVAALLGLAVTQTKPRRAHRRPTIRERILSSLTPAMLGAGLGFAYARHILDPDALQTSKLPAMYATMGAVLAILAIRLTAMFRAMFQDFFGKADDDGEP